MEGPSAGPGARTMKEMAAAAAAGVGNGRAKSAPRPGDSERASFRETRWPVGMTGAPRLRTSITLPYSRPLRAVIEKKSGVKKKLNSRMSNSAARGQVNRGQGFCSPLRDCGGVSGGAIGGEGMEFALLLMRPRD